MKKTISVFLLLAICISVASCTSQAEKVTDKLSSGSTWVFDSTVSGKETMHNKRTYKFEDEMVYVHVVSESTGVMQLMDKDCWYFGTYGVDEITKGTITIYISYEKNKGEDEYSPSDRGKMHLFYTYENGVLKLFEDAEHTMELK